MVSTWSRSAGRGQDSACKVLSWGKCQVPLKQRSRVLLFPVAIAHERHPGAIRTRLTVSFLHIQ